VQDLSAGARQTSAAYQYTLQGDDSEQLYSWTAKLTAALQRDKRLVDVNSDQQAGWAADAAQIDRDAAGRLGISTAQIGQHPYDAYGQRQVSVIYGAQNQYHVVMEVEPRLLARPEDTRASVGQWVGCNRDRHADDQCLYRRGQHGWPPPFSDPRLPHRRRVTLRPIRLPLLAMALHRPGTAVSTAKETMVPLAAVTAVNSANTPLTVNHQGPFVATTISFNLPPGRSLSEAMQAVTEAGRRIGLPASIHGTFSGTRGGFSPVRWRASPFCSWQPSSRCTSCSAFSMRVQYIR